MWQYMQQSFNGKLHSPVSTASKPAEEWWAFLRRSKQKVPNVIIRHFVPSAEKRRPVNLLSLSSL